MDDDSPIILRAHSARLLRPEGAVFASRVRSRGDSAGWAALMALSAALLLSTALPSWTIALGRVARGAAAGSRVRSRWVRVRVGRTGFVIDHFDRWFTSAAPTERELLERRGRLSVRASLEEVAEIAEPRCGDLTVRLTDGRTVRVSGRGLTTAWMAELATVLRQLRDWPDAGPSRHRPRIEALLRRLSAPTAPSE